MNFDILGIQVEKGKWGWGMIQKKHCKLNIKSLLTLGDNFSVLPIETDVSISMNFCCML